MEYNNFELVYKCVKYCSTYALYIDILKNINMNMIRSCINIKVLPSEYKKTFIISTKIVKEKDYEPFGYR